VQGFKDYLEDSTRVETWKLNPTSRDSIIVTTLISIS
jgi:hypothetical protein